MPDTIRPAVSLALLLSLAACTGAPRPQTAARPAGGGEPAARSAGDPIDPLARSLAAALARGSWTDLRIDAECRDEETGRLRSIALYGTGVGIWNGERLFNVPRERLLAALEAIRRAGFGSMRESHGGREDPGNCGLELICRVRLVLDGLEKQSYQLSKGRQSAELKGLSEQLLAIGDELGPSGVAAGSLEEGLDKLARGELAPEALTLQLQRQPEDPRSTEGGWILRVEGGKAQLSLASPETGWADPRRALLSRDELAALAGALAAARPDDLPANLYSSWYQDLEIRVLNRTKSLQARRFANLTPETHGEKQKRFDRLVAALEELEKRLAG